MKNPVVVVAGGGGLVGEDIIRLLQERAFPAREVRTLSARHTQGTPDFQDVDLVFLAVPEDIARAWAPLAVQSGATVIDCSGAWRMDEKVSLQIPGITPATESTDATILASPNCTNIGLCAVLDALKKGTQGKDCIVTSFQSLSGEGRSGLEKLKTTSADVSPLCDVLQEDGHTLEERRVIEETKKILALPNLPISVTCTRVPLAQGHALSLLFESEPQLSIEKATELLRASPLLCVSEEGNPPTPAQSVGESMAQVGRIRHDEQGRLWLWVCFDNLGFAGALNAVKIAEEWMVGQP
ncbi:MAG: Asd/ArgC dimerization domain-containing protein [Planctomycetota bacterium]|nr:Asd/ArgC dimerization domain-containing protein [Planctomycetota bacterium]